MTPQHGTGSQRRRVPPSGPLATLREPACVCGAKPMPGWRVCEGCWHERRGEAARG